MIIGELEYKEKQYNFTIEEDILKLILKENKINNIFGFFENFGKIEELETDYLIGQCQPDNHEIIIFVDPFTSKNSTKLLKVNYIFEFKNNITIFDHMIFYVEEINYIYNVQKAIEYKINDDGTRSILLKSNNETSSEWQTFIFEGKSILFKFGIGQTTNLGNSNIPITLQSAMVFKFEETDNYEFLIQLYHLAKNLIMLLCNRNNFIINNVKLLNLKKQLNDVCNFTSLEDKNILKDNKRVLEKNFLSYDLIKNNINKIFQDLADKKIYLDHIPISRKNGLIITNARFLLITAAFEWEFERKYPEGIKHKNKTIEARELVKEHLNNQINKNTGKAKEIFKYLLDDVDNDTLSSKFNHAYGHMEDILKNYTKNLYEENKEKFDCIKCGERIAKQRNNFAHGNIEQEFIGTSILDINLLEKMVYLLQFSHYDIDMNDIKKEFGNLFGVTFER